ncbi:DUF1071 domain-containing protein [Caenimonas sp. SL110]|uniref:Sak single strand annealing protein n=1 Tax=Caenimonas sp. SL110 TaxID=1450524 RepID=UPI00069D4061|nr:DUF1071 domain-containing protein [Caenimonas sp. SL110]
MEKVEQSAFARLNAVNVSGHLEMKGQFSYLSWPFAVAELRKVEPSASWEVRRFHDGELPYLQTDLGFFVEVAVTVGGVTLSQIHPILDTKNRPIVCPTAFDVNTSIQRCLVKAIALHGLGLSVFAGEDLSLVEEQPVSPPPRPAAAKRATQLKQVGTCLSVEQQNRVKKLVEQTKADMARLLDYYNVESLADIRANQFDRVVRSLEHRRAA